MISMTRCLFLVLPITLAACNTVAGMGQDLAAAGRALSNTAGKIVGSEPTQAAAPPAAAQGSSTPRSLSQGPQAPTQPEEAK